MGIDISGGMIVGNDHNQVNIDQKSIEVTKDNQNELFNEDGEIDENYYFSEVMDNMSPYYDAPIEDRTVGFTVNSKVKILSPEFDRWVEEVKKKAVEFEKVTNTDAYLIGMQHVS